MELLLVLLLSTGDRWGATAEEDVEDNVDEGGRETLWLKGEAEEVAVVGILSIAILLLLAA